jgi:hypothetical protein
MLWMLLNKERVMALAFGTSTSARDCHALTLGEESGGCKTTEYNVCSLV